MAAATGFTITFTLISLLLLAIYLSPWNQTYNLPSVSDWPLKSSIGHLQHEIAALNIKKNDTRLAIEGQLAKARSKIRKAIVEKSFASSQKNGSFIPVGTMYKNPFAFYQLSIQTI
ncbi:hypothetical protein L1887_03063 [Cichorium endivia]|nr:hypothetical protein L1887_03063 [Cichorium endivia]